MLYRLSRAASIRFLLKGHNSEYRGCPCLQTRPVSQWQMLKKQMKAAQRLDGGPDFIEGQQELRESARDESFLKGMDTFDGSQFDEQLVISDEDEETVREKKLALLKCAIELYKERTPRLRQDHGHFVQWCILRMFEYDLTEEVELYELLIECYPPHMYHVRGKVEQMIPKIHPGYISAFDLFTVGEQRKVKPTYKLYRNVCRAFGEGHQLVSMVRRWGWFHYVFRNSNPYPLKDGTYDFASLANRHQAMVEYVAERTMDQKCVYEPLANEQGEYLGTAVASQTQQDLSKLQVPDDTMRLTGPHSIWVGRLQRWYWVLRREERGDEFEGAPLAIFVSPHKELSREGAHVWLERCREKYKGIAGSNVLLEEPDELLAINPEAHFKERVALFSDGIDDVFIETSILPDLVDEKKKQSIKELAGSKDKIRMEKSRSPPKDDDEW